MGFRVGSLNSSSKRSDTGKSSKNTNIGVVIDVIYDDSHPRVSADGPGDRSGCHSWWVSVSVGVRSP